MPEDNNNALLAEQLCEQLLPALLQEKEVNMYDFSAALYPDYSEALSLANTAANRLVKEKLAVYTGENRATLAITNFGRYWLTRGGYGAYLREGHETTKQHNEKQHHKEELLEARLRLTHFRLIAFWLTLVFSIVGFALSLINLYLLLNGNK